MTKELFFVFPRDIQRHLPAFSIILFSYNQSITNIKSDITHNKILELTLRMLLANNIENCLQLPDSFKDITNHDRKLQILMVESFKIANNLSPAIMGKFSDYYGLLL